MSEQDEKEREKEEPRILTLEEKWKMDEEMQVDGSNYQVFMPQCRSCRYAQEDALEECQKYHPIPWEILTVQVSCPYYRNPEDPKPQLQLEYITIEEKNEILQYHFLPEEAIRQVRKSPALAIWAYEKNNPVCGAVFTQESDRNGFGVVLQYICTLDRYRNLGVASNVMKYAQKLFAESGITRMSACSDWVEYPLEEADPNAAFLEKLGWEQELCEWQGLEYQPKHIISEKLKAFASGNMDGIFYLSPDARKRILAEDPDIPMALKEYLKDSTISNNSLVYATDRKTDGAVILEKKKGYQMCIRYLYVNPECKDKTILLRLLVLIFGNKDNWSGKGNILICAPDTKIVKLLEYLFGKPDKRICRKMYRTAE